MTLNMYVSVIKLISDTKLLLPKLIIVSKIPKKDLPRFENCFLHTMYIGTLPVSLPFAERRQSSAAAPSNSAYCHRSHFSRPTHDAN